MTRKSVWIHQDLEPGPSFNAQLELKVSDRRMILWQSNQPLNLTEVDPNIEGEFSLAQWNHDALSSSSNAISRVLFDDS